MSKELTITQWLADLGAVAQGDTEGMTTTEIAAALNISRDDARAKLAIGIEQGVIEIGYAKRKTPLRPRGWMAPVYKIKWHPPQD